MQTTRFLITGVGGQGTILASDVLAEVGLRLGYDAKKWLEGLRRMAYTNPDTMILANDWRIDPVAVSSGQAEYPAVEGIRNTMRERCAALHVLPATPMAVDMGNARVFNSIIMGKLSLLVGGDGDVWRSAVADTVAPKVRDLNVRAFDAGRSFGL